VPDPRLDGVYVGSRREPVSLSVRRGRIVWAENVGATARILTASA
jgi:hypothetical protein